jgi:hypothetical protein
LIATGSDGRIGKGGGAKGCKNNIGNNGEILRTVVGKKQKWQWSETVWLDEGVF